MEKRKDIEASGGEAPKTELPETAKSEAAKADLPIVESPSISPATPAAEPVAEAFPPLEPVVAPAIEAAPAVASPSRFVLRPRHKRYALLAASVAIAAALGGIIGAVASGGFSTPAPQIDASANDRKALEQTLAKLAKEVTTLKVSLDAANKSAQSQIAKITERFDRSASEEMITGSISAPQTTTPMPTPRPAPRIAAVEIQPPSRPAVVTGWSIRDARDGMVYVQGNGEIYEVVPGAPLPGLGPVESIKVQDGRWVVKTPKGIIVSMRDRRYFGAF